MSQIQAKYKIVFLLLAAILLLIWCIAYSGYLNSEKNHRHIVERFSKKLQQKEVAVKKISNTLVAELDTIPGTVFFDRSRFNPIENGQGIILQAFRDGYPVFWSNNTVRLVPDAEDTAVNPSLYLSDNGVYRKISIKNKDMLIIGLILIKSNFVYQNEYLRNEFNPVFKIPEQAGLSLNIGEYNIFSDDGTFLFSLVFPENYVLSTNEVFILFIPFLIFFIILLISAGYIVSEIKSLGDKKLLSIIFYTVFLLLIRFGLEEFQIPEKLFTSQIFSPNLYAFGIHFSSLGSLLLNSITLLFISGRIFTTLPSMPILLRNASVMINLIISGIIFIVIIGLFDGVVNLVSSLVINSQEPFNPGNIEEFSFYGFITLLSACLLLISFLILTNGLLTVYIKRFPEIKLLTYYTFASILFVILPYYIILAPTVLEMAVLFILISGTLFIKLYTIKYKGENAAFLAGIIIISLFITILLNSLNTKKEFSKRKILAEKLTSGRDFFAEYLFAELTGKISVDNELNEFIIEDTIASENLETQISNYIKMKYFQGYWSKFNFLFTYCDPEKILEVKPDNFLINCHSYFEEVVQKRGIKTECPDLYYLNNTSINDNYIGIIRLNNKRSEGGRIYIEFFPKYLPTGLGYPEILSNKDYGLRDDLSEYSWANYEDGALVHYYGSYFYETVLRQTYGSLKRYESYTESGYNHLIFRPDKENVFILSRKTNTLTSFNTCFSILIISLLITGYFISLISGRQKVILFSVRTFRNRLQFSYVVLILVSFLFIGSASFFYLLNLNDQKNNSLLREKAHSVLVELKHKISGLDSVTNSSEYLEDLLFKFSLVFFTDIHLYDLSGSLIATSRPEIFNQGLIAPLMNSEAYNRMINYRLTEYLQEEKIGNYSYISAYLPFYNEKNELIAYINLPYFAKQNELKYEISNLLMAFVNIYFLLFVIALMIVFGISKYVNKPIEILRRRIASLRLGTLNEKIEWKRDDEIGSLVKEYNRMIDELAKSAELLAKSERESAWRQMAQQIAHEIKNPLTPMKLSVQFLNRAWADQLPDFEKRLRKFTETMIEQIDSLSFIASEFSNFAKFQQSDLTMVDLREAIGRAFDRFRDITSVKIEYETPPHPYWVQANNERLVRVFHNLISNSIQAMDEIADGYIRITLETKDGWHIIHFVDNGTGIPEDMQQKIFSPYFTTKSGGTGLGLAIVKNIISTYGGTIEFTSASNKGTTFIMRLPVYMKPNE